MKRIMADTLRLIAFIGFPAAVLLIALSQPLIRLVFERGAFNSDSTTLTAASLTYYAFALVALAMIEVIARTFYALEDTWTPILVGAVQLLLMFGLGYWLGRGVFPRIGRFGASGIALGFSISNWFEVIALLVLLRRKINGIDGRYTLHGVGRITIAALAMYVVTIAGWRLFPAANSVLQLALNLTLMGVVSGGVYVAVCLALRVKEMEGLLRPILRRINR
jgi:putative peptidoglycan lipid II flippase